MIKELWHFPISFGIDLIAFPQHLEKQTSETDGSTDDRFDNR